MLPVASELSVTPNSTVILYIRGSGDAALQGISVELPKCVATIEV